MIPNVSKGPEYRGPIASARDVKPSAFDPSAKLLIPLAKIIAVVLHAIILGKRRIEVATERSNEARGRKPEKRRIVGRADCRRHSANPCI